MVKASYDWKRFVPGLTTYALCTWGNNRKDPVTGQVLADECEVDGDIQYRITKGFLNGLWLRLRFANLWEEGGGTVQQVRVILNMPVPFL